MKFGISKSVRSRTHVATQDEFLRIVRSADIKAVQARIDAAETHDAKGEVKKELPIVTWQAWYDEGIRSNRRAHPSGLFMLDIDGIDNPAEFYQEKVSGNIDRLHILVVHITPSRRGLRIVAECQQPTLAECQRVMADTLGTEYDSVCSDFARSSFLVPFEFFEYLDNSIFTKQPSIEIQNPDYESKENGSTDTTGSKVRPATASAENGSTPDGQDSGQTRVPTHLFGEDERTYKGLDIREIGRNWLKATGGEPVEGERNARLYQLAIRLRYITDFNAGIIFNNIDHYGLPDAEVKQLVSSACSANRMTNTPKDLLSVIDQMQGKKEEDEKEPFDTKGVFDYLMPEGQTLPLTMMPPVFREFVSCANDDFKTPTYMALLPLLGTLASRLRAEYFDGVLHSPSFQVEVEAPMASGKSFVTRLYKATMYPLKAADDENRKKEAEYKRKLKLAKNDKKQPEPESFPIRLIPATASITQVLRRMANADCAHLLSFTDEIRIVLESYGRGSYGNLRALMRNAFDNAAFGQDFANSDAPNDYVDVYLNTLHAGTPAEYGKFYNNVEDGTVSRVLFAVLPDQFGKQYKRPRSMTSEELVRVNKKLDELNAVTMDGTEVRHDVVNLRNFDFMAEWALQWCREKQQIAVKYQNRDLDTFMRRSAVVGFRAGMLVWFLFGQKLTKSNIAKTIANAQWVAEYMLYQLMRRYETSITSNVIQYYEIWQKLPEKFTLADMNKATVNTNFKTPIKLILHRWKKKGLIKVTADGNYQKVTK